MVRSHACDDKPSMLSGSSSHASSHRPVDQAMGVKRTKQQIHRAACMYGGGPCGGEWVRVQMRRGLNEPDGG